jgi:hypothetical protein
MRATCRRVDPATLPLPAPKDCKNPPANSVLIGMQAHTVDDAAAQIAAVRKSVGRKPVKVRLPPPAPRKLATVLHGGAVGKPEGCGRGDVTQ